MYEQKLSLYAYILVNLTFIKPHDYYQQSNYVYVENRIQSVPWEYGPLTEVEIPNKHGEQGYLVMFADYKKVCQYHSKK